MRARISTIFFLLTAFNFVYGQAKNTPREVKAKKNYTHSATKTVFPEILFDDYRRKTIRSFDKKNKDISVLYEKEKDGEKTTFSLYLYPAGSGYEGRLRKEYQNSIQSAAITKKELHAMQFAVQHKGKKHTCNGFKALFTNEQNDLSLITLFESGTWFYKIIITTNQSDTTLISDLEKKIMQRFDPSDLAGLNLLNDKVSVYFSKSAFRDSTLLGSAMGSAFRKIDWIMKNVEERERAAGFPDLYLNLHVEGLKAFLEFQHSSASVKSEFTENYLRELQLIYDADFLSDFIMEQYDMILKIPENIPVRYDEYLKWKAENNISVGLNDQFYVLSLDAGK